MCCFQRIVKPFTELQYTVIPKCSQQLLSLAKTLKTHCLLGYAFDQGKCFSGYKIIFVLKQKEYAKIFAHCNVSLSSAVPSAQINPRTIICR